MPSSILFVHQGYELYGSDRTLIQSVQAAAHRWPEARITVLLPCDGALRKALLPVVDDVRIVDLAVLRKSNFKKMKLRDVAGFIRKILEARRMMRAYDVTYINTVVIMDYMFAAGVTRQPCIVHVHEIPNGLAALFFSVMLTLGRASLIFNSHATQRSFRLPFWQRKAVVWNGVATPPELPPTASHSKLNLLLIGRFNSWKGQEVLLRAVAQISPELRSRLSVRLVGSVFGDQSHFADMLVRIVGEQGLSEIVEMFPFTPDPYPHYTWADVVVVPSTKPEPFGLVAIEAMAEGRCVIAANHGGLSEIVVNGVTGSFVVPGSIESLAAAIVSYMNNPARVAAEGNAGRKRFAAEFEESHYKLKIANIIVDVTRTKAADFTQRCKP
jgi:glycosyltransferase involved in cell wall biosynthesis